eukprot:g23829.t1
MKLFYGLNPAFIRSLANITERKMNFLGDVFKEEGSTDRTLRVQEFGKVRVETNREGMVALTDVGTLLGESMFLGMSHVAEATFRAATPLLVMLWIPHHSFENIMNDGYPTDAWMALAGSRKVPQGAYFRSLDRTDQGREDMSHYAKYMKLFRGCGQSFIHDIGECIHRRAYKPGQTILVQAAIDDRAWLRFCELTLLGLVLLRSATVVATTYCIPCCARCDVALEETVHFEQLMCLRAVQVAAERGTFPFLKKASERLQLGRTEAEFENDSTDS